MFSPSHTLSSLSLSSPFHSPIKKVAIVSHKDVWSHFENVIKETTQQRNLQGSHKQACTYHNLPKIGPPSIYASVYDVMLSKKHQRSSTEQEEGLTNEGRHHLLLFRKQALDKRGIAESQHVYITRGRLTVRWVHFRAGFHAKGGGGLEFPPQPFPPPPENF